MKFYEKGLEESRNKAYEKALDFFDRAITEAPNFIDAYLKKAAIYYDLGQFEASVDNFEKAVSLKPDYRSRTSYQMGLAALSIPNYQKAIQAFQNYIDQNPSNKQLLARAERHLSNAKFAAVAVQKPVPFNPKRLPENINSPAPEFLPSISIDGQSFVFNRLVNGQEDFFISYKKDEEWQLAQPIHAVNTPQNEAAQTISADGKIMVLTACNRKNGFGGCDLFLSVKNKDQWQQPQLFPKPVNSKYWESTPSIAGNKDALFFASDRPGGSGGRDIWVSYFERAQWQAPINLGPNVNSDGDEQSPFIHPDGETLYFMSNGRPGMGSFDLYYSKKQPDGTWGPARNLGYPINTPGDEGAMIVTRDGKTAYFASSKLSGATVSGNLNEDSDLYQFELPATLMANPVTYLKAKVFDAVTLKPINAVVELKDLDQNISFNSFTADESGTFLVCIPSGRSYSLNVNQKGYLFYSDHFNLKQEGSFAKPYSLEIPLEPVPEIVNASKPNLKKKQPIILRNIFFESGASTLLPSSISELQKLKQLLEDNPSLKIQINASTFI